MYPAPEEQYDEDLKEDESITPASNAAATADEKMEKFKEVATRRVSNACKAIRLIGNLSNRGAYHYDDAHIEKIFAALEQELADVKAKFQPTKEEKSSFSFE